MMGLAWVVVTAKAGMHLLAAYLHASTRDGLSDSAVHTFYRANQLLGYASLAVLAAFLWKRRHREVLILSAGCHVLYTLEAMHTIRPVAEFIVRTAQRVALAITAGQAG